MADNGPPGLDVFYDRPPHDGVLDSKMRMGKMYCKAMPFHCVMVYDDSDDYAFIHEVWERARACGPVRISPLLATTSHFRDLPHAFIVREACRPRLPLDDQPAPEAESDAAAAHAGGSESSLSSRAIRTRRV